MGSKDNIIHQDPESHDVSLTDSPLLLKTKIPNGVITQFNEPVPTDLIPDMAPPTPKSHRRNLSFLNSPTKNMELKEWEKSNDRDPQGTCMNMNTIWLSQYIHFLYIEDTYFDAILIGTDNDYLETSKMRAIFRENTLTDDDVTLFEMPAVMSPSEINNVGQQGQSSPFLVGDLRFRERSCFYQCICTPPPTIMDSMSPGMQLFHHCKCYLIATLFIFALFFITFYLMQQGAVAKSNQSKNI